MSRSVLKFLVVLAALGLFATTAAADSFAFNIAGTIPSSGKYVTSTVKISTEANGFKVEAANTTTNPSDITQILDAIQFNLKSGVSLGSLQLTSASAQIRDIAGNGTYTKVNSTTLGSDTSSQIDWGLASGSAFKLCAGAYGGGSCPLHPNGIIGKPDSNNLYSNANPSITNDPHTPELFGTFDTTTGAVKPVTFHVYASGVTGSDLVSKYIDSANFYYGTGGGNDNIKVCLSCTNGGGNVPEPASIFLLGSGMAGLASKLRKRK